MNSPSDLPAVRAVRLALEGASTPEQVGRATLEAVGDMLGWLAGAVWRPASVAGDLRTVATWRARVHKATAFEEFTRSVTLAPGLGLPGQVWRERRIVWVMDVTREPDFIRARFAGPEGLLGAVAFPATDGERVVGVVEFFTDRFRSPQPVLELVLGQIGPVVGAALARTRG